MAGTLCSPTPSARRFDELVRRRQRGHRRLRPAARSLSTTTSSATSAPGSTRRCSTTIAGVDGVRRRRGRHRGLRPARRQRRRAHRQPRHGRARRSAATGSPTTTLNPFDVAEGRAPDGDRRGRDRPPQRRRRRASRSATAITVLTQAGTLEVDARRHRHASATTTAPVAPRSRCSPRDGAGRTSPSRARSTRSRSPPTTA